jgi:DMSO/TMAO reductase YedYZ molybdopterin-dependent catalytic subunit
MSVRSPSPSPFRPKGGLPSEVIEQVKPLLRDISRRKLLGGSFSLGALSMLTGCSVTDTSPVESFMSVISAFNDKVQELIFRPNHLAPTFREDQVVKPPRFNAYYDVEDVKPVDGKTWKLELAGLINDKKPWTAEQIGALPEQEMIVRHICVEGWDYIGQWSGVNLRQFLERIGADLKAKYVHFKCADDYTESLDMATALHPQTILATKYAREPIADPFGFPLRLRTATKLGFKNAKWVTAIEVTNTFTDTYWSKRGFNWFAGI